MPDLTIAYMTNRPDPCFQWFVDSLCNQLSSSLNVEVIIVDLLMDYCPDERLSYYQDAINGRCEAVIIPPKPTPWQGKHRKTTEDMFAAANARNTAFIYANSNYIVCVDDLSVLSEGYISNVLHAKEHNYVMFGSYQKCSNLVVESGKIKSFGEVVSKDVRTGGDGAIPCEGQWLFGCNFGLPLDAIIRTNGFDEYHDGLGAEDCDFGIRLKRAGYQTFYNANALTTESYEMHFQQGVFHRQNRLSYTGEDVDWYMVNRLNEQSSRFTTLGNWTNIEKLREEVREGKGITAEALPVIDWATKKPFDQIPHKEKNEA